MAPRRGIPGREYSSEPLRGPTIRIQADDDGVVQLATPEQVRLADELRLPIWRPGELAPGELDAASTDEEPDEDLSKLTVVVLRERLAEADLDTTGKKPELVERLQAHLELLAAQAAAEADQDSDDDNESTDEEPDEPAEEE